MNLKEASEYLGRNADEVKRLAGSGIIPAIKLSTGQWFFYQKDLDEWSISNPHQTYKLNLSTEELQTMVQNRTYKQVAKELGVSSQAVGYHMLKMGVRRYGKH